MFNGCGTTSESRSGTANLGGGMGSAEALLNRLLRPMESLGTFPELTRWVVVGGLCKSLD